MTLFNRKGETDRGARLSMRKRITILRPAAILYGHNPRSFKELSEEMKQYDAIQAFPVSGDSDGHAVGVFLLK